MRRIALAALFAQQRSWKPSVALGRRTAIVFALLLGVAIYALRLADDNVADVPLFLFVVPVALCAVTFGLKGGLVSALVGFAATGAWYAKAGEAISVIGYSSRAAAFLVVGALVGRFVDERRIAERELSRHQELSLDLIGTADFSGHFVRLNPAWTSTLGWTIEELTSRPFLDFVHPEDREATAAQAGQLAEEGENVVDFQNRYRCRDGSYRWLEWKAKADAETKLIFAVARDVSVRKEAERAILHHREILEQAVQERTQQLRAQTVELDEARLETLRRLALAAEFRDDETYEHTERVGRTAALLGERLGLPEAEVSLLRQASPLHDIGKLSVSDAILLKPAKLTLEEFEQLKRHSAAGAAILAGSKSPVLQRAEQIALTHHEWWDGSGYPMGLKEEAIPLSGRIVAVADVFDALTHTRPYKEAWPVDKAVDEICRLRGVKFDPRIVAAFEELDHLQLAGYRDLSSTPATNARQLTAAS